MIYRGKRIINWCPVSQTALSDEEVIMKPRKDKLVYVRYPLAKKPGEYITIATVRPETILADVAIAVNPNDPRYSDLIGELAVVPVAGRHVPVIADDYVDIEFGTGALKITPAHDPNDFDVAGRHNLPVLCVVGRDGKMTDEFGYAGLDRFEAREKIIADLESRGSLVKVEDYDHNVGYSERADVVVEPYLSEQWFVKMRPLAEKALQVVNDGEIRFHPSHWISTYRHWMENIQDWCISRQLWWGHRIPAWYDQEGKIWVAESLEEACHLAGTDKLIQDEDVLDTWFSSWLWPLTTLGWTGEHTDNDDIRAFYPTDTLVTAPDIIFFWVARMIMAGLYFKGDVPFRDVYFTSIIRDMKGRKLSKSLGNSPDPLKVIDAYGTDALRFTIVYIAPLGQDVLFGEEKCEFGRNFATKIWNAARLAFMQRERVFGDMDEFSAAYQRFIPESMSLSDAESWILGRYHETLDAYHKAFGQFRMNDITRIVYDFFRNDYCDWYLETLKIELAEDAAESGKRDSVCLAVYLLEGVLKVLHPVMPFITEEIWHHILFHGSSKSIAQSDMPQAEGRWLGGIPADFTAVQKVISETRSLRAVFGVPHDMKASLVINAPEESSRKIFAANTHIVMQMTDCSVDVSGGGLQRPPHSASSVVDGNELFMPLEGLISFDKEIARLEKEADRVSSYVKRMERKLANKGFVDNAPVDVVENERRKLVEAKSNLGKLKANLKVLCN